MWTVAAVVLSIFFILGTWSFFSDWVEQKPGAFWKVIGRGVKTVNFSAGILMVAIFAYSIYHDFAREPSTTSSKRKAISSEGTDCTTEYDRQGSYVVCTPTASAGTSKGYTCTKDCSGHEAGYEWAKRRGISDRTHCTGKSQSFVEGCIAYADGR